MPETNRFTARGARAALPLLLWLPLLATALLLFGCAAQSSQPSGQEPSAEDETEESQTGGVEEEASRSGLGTPTLGDADAPVVMVEYGDFQ